MNILGLKGFSRYGNIDQYFNVGCFPQKNNWRPTLEDANFIFMEYTQYVLSYDKKSTQYIAICFSDGGSVGHLLPLLDPDCVGLIAHSATFPKRKVMEIAKSDYSLARSVPILLIENNNDLTKWLPSWYGKTKDAFVHYYKQSNANLEYHILPGNSWHGHDFDNAFGIMHGWCKHNFDFKLPVK